MPSTSAAAGYYKGNGWSGGTLERWRGFWHRFSTKAASPIWPVPRTCHPEWSEGSGKVRLADSRGGKPGGNKHEGGFV